MSQHATLHRATAARGPLVSFCLHCVHCFCGVQSWPTKSPTWWEQAETVASGCYCFRLITFSRQQSVFLMFCKRTHECFKLEVCKPTAKSSFETLFFCKKGNKKSLFTYLLLLNHCSLLRCASLSWYSFLWAWLSAALLSLRPIITESL